MLKKTVAILSSLCVVLTVLLLLTCTTSNDRSYPTIEICVFSDPHLYDPSLGTSGSAFEDYLMEGRKLVAESEEIVKSLIDLILAERAEIVLVPGDLTKDGERASHYMIAGYLEQLESAGKRVYVIPGNHDIDNPHAVGYSGDDTFPAESITAEEFVEIYRDFGYAEAIARDSSSLSYVVEPIDGFWLLAMDSCLYRENSEHPVAGGRFSGETLDWIVGRLRDAQTRNITVFGMMHHSVVEHFSGQKIFFPDYVLDDWTTVSREFAQNGMNVVFTGHFHAQDVVKKEYDDDYFIFDIETGATVTYPCPFRIVTLDSSGKLNIWSRKITQIDFDTGGKPFQDYALDFLENGLDDVMASMLMENFKLSTADAQQIAPHMASGLIAHYAGDERPSEETLSSIQQLQESDNLTKQIIGSGLLAIWTDLSPADNEIIIDLATGRADF